MSAPPAARSVLVTGASGLIGHNVVAQLCAARSLGEWSDLRTVVAADVSEPPESRRCPGVDYCRLDVRDPDLERAMVNREVDTVVHLAAIVSPGPESSREHEYSVDVLGTKNVLECAIRAGVRQLIYTSSGAAYGYHPDNPEPLRESDPLRGNEEFAYSYHKRLAEEMLARARHDHPELLQLIFRPGAILGSRAENPITAIFDRPIVIGVRGSDAPFVFVWDEDVARCIVEGIRYRRSGIFNLCGDGTITLPEIARRIGKRYLAVPAPLLELALYLGRKMGATRLGPEQVRFLRYRPVLSNERLESEFGFTPTYSSEECFAHFWKLHFAE